MLGLPKWQSAGIVGLLGVVVLTVTWLHGRNSGIESERQDLLVAHAEALSKAINEQAAAARTMGQAVELARQREAEAIAAMGEVERAAAQREARWRKQREQDPDCDAWMRAPVACRLRDEAAAGGQG